jgi:hypothetical protein
VIPTERLFKAASGKTLAKDVTSDYGSATGEEAWETMKVEYLAAAVHYKVERAMQPSTSPAKVEDDLADAAAFLAAIYERKVPRP